MAADPSRVRTGTPLTVVRAPLPLPRAGSCGSASVQAGVPQPEKFGHAWVPLGLLKADPSCSRNFTLWMEKSANDVVAKLMPKTHELGLADAKISAVAPVAGVASPVAAAPAASGAIPPGWTKHPQGRALADNLLFAMATIGQLPVETRYRIIESCFAPAQLQATFEHWRRISGPPLPNP